MTIPQQHHFFDVDALLTRIGVDVGMKIADFGCGRDVSLVSALAKKVTTTGVVYALDIVKNVLQVLNDQLKMAGVNNVQTIWTDLEIYGAARGIGNETIDVGVVLMVLNQSKKRGEVLKECIRMIKTGGKLFVLEWKPRLTAIGPPTEHRVSAEEVKQIALDLNLKIIEEFEASEYHWAILFQK